jgi:ribosomal protein L37E
MSVFFNPHGVPEMACDNCGSRWYDRMTNCCYECGQPVTEEMLAEYNQALAEFNRARAAKSTG